VDILIVEDDERMAALLRRGLAAEGHVTEVATDGALGLEFAVLRSFDVMILDLMIPKLGGLEVARQLRERGVKTPILMLTAKDAPKDIVAGLDMGADDYLTKPFSFEELLARVRAVSRRGPIPTPTVLKVHDLRLDPASREVSRGERRLSLTPREFQILELLLRRAGRVLSRDDIIESVWGHEVDVEPNTVDVFVGTLRSKVDGPESRKLIRTARGVGFSIGVSEL
jgi:two-component system, OmpR family, response regulator